MHVEVACDRLVMIPYRVLARESAMDRVHRPRTTSAELHGVASLSKHTGHKFK
jgi:hypothetical protein